LQNEKFDVILLVILLFTAVTNGALLPSASLTLQEVHLVRCLTYISHRYFTSGRYLMISSPATYRDVQQELIAEIHRSFNWPLIVTVDGNISKPENTDFIDGDASYIILIPDGNFMSFVAEVNGLILGQRKFKGLWNSETRFVVAGANEYTKSQQTDIFEHLSMYRIYNCIIVSKDNYVTDKEYSRPINVNDVDTSTKFGVYTWFPYQGSDRCTEVNDITLLDRWVISAQGHFTKNANLFPQKTNKSLNWCPMKTVVRNGRSHFTTVYLNHTYTNGTVYLYFKGPEIDLFMIVLQQMNMTFVHVPTPEGFEIEHGSFINLISPMKEKKVYIAFGDLGTRAITIFDSTNSYCFKSVRWYVPCTVKYPRWSSIFRIFSVELWIVLIISIVIAAISTTRIARYSCTSEWQGYKTLSSSLTNMWAVILGVSVSTMPRTPSLRSLFLACVVFSLVFSTVFQAFLTTFLIDSGYKTPIQNMDEMFGSGIKLVYPQEYNYIFNIGDETEALKVHSNHVNCPSTETCLKWAKLGKNLSVLLSDIMAEVSYATGDLIGDNSEQLLCVLQDGAVFFTGLSMSMLHGDPLLRRVTEIIDRVFEAGLYNYWISMRINWLKVYSRKIAIVNPLDGYYSFELYHMQPAFYLLLMGWCLSTICFMMELLFNGILTKIT